MRLIANVSFLILLFLSLNDACMGQHSSLRDSLANVISTDKSDTNKVRALNKLAQQLCYSNPDTAILLCESALSLLQQARQPMPSYTRSNMTAAVYYTLGVLHYLQTDYASAVNYYSLSYKLYKALAGLTLPPVQKAGKKGMAYCESSLGLIYWQRGDYPSALSRYMKALKLNDELGNKAGMGTTFNNIGIIYYEQKDFPNAMHWYQKALKINEELNNKKEEANLCTNIGILFKVQSDSDFVSQGFNPADRYPMAIRFYLKSLQIKQELNDENGKASSYTNMGSLLTDVFEKLEFNSAQSKDKVIPLSEIKSLSDLQSWPKESLLDTALMYHMKSLELDRALKDEYSMTFALSGIGNIYLKRGLLIKAVAFFKESVTNAKKTGALDRERAAHSGLVDCYELMNRDDLALIHYKKMVALQDSIFNEEKSKDIGKLEAKHEFEQAEAERKRSEEQARLELEESEQRRNNLQYSGILIFLVLVFSAIFMLSKLAVPIWLAEGMIFFSFLLFFEFTLVMLDPYIEQYSGGEPAYKLLFNALLAAAIFPLHSLFESKLKSKIMA